MGCELALHIWDKEAMVPVDYDLKFGASSLSWPDRIATVKRERDNGFILTYYESEHRSDSIDGVRCWMTDFPSNVLEFAMHVKAEHWGDPDERIFKIIDRWRETPGRLRFVFELV